MVSIAKKEVSSEQDDPQKDWPVSEEEPDIADVDFKLYHCTTGSSNKHWAVGVCTTNNRRLYIVYGAFGQKKRFYVKEFTSQSEREKYTNKKILGKERKGYTYETLTRYSVNDLIFA